MGMSASQARLLSLTSRQHDIEYKAQKIEAQKLQMANESNKVYQEYENVLNSTKIQAATIGSNGNTVFADANLNMIENAAGAKAAKTLYLKNTNNDKIKPTRATGQHHIICFVVSQTPAMLINAAMNST